MRETVLTSSSPAALQITRWPLVLAALTAVALGYWLYARHAKNDRGAIARMSFSSTIGDIEVDGKHYKGEWSDDVKSFSGTIQWPGPAARSAVPS